MHLDFYHEVLAHGVAQGFGYTVSETVLTIGPGLGFCRGTPLQGNWQVDFAGHGEGWWSLAVNEAGVAASRALFAPTDVPLAFCLTDGDGMVQTLRDVRRHCWPFLWEEAVAREAWLTFAPLQPLRLRRVQAGVCDLDEESGIGVWHCSKVILPTSLGAVLEGWFSAPLKLDKQAPFGAGVVVEGYYL